MKNPTGRGGRKKIPEWLKSPYPNMSEKDAPIGLLELQKYRRKLIPQFRKLRAQLTTREQKELLDIIAAQLSLRETVSLIQRLTDIAFWYSSGIPCKGPKKAHRPKEYKKRALLQDCDNVVSSLIAKNQSIKRFAPEDVAKIWLKPKTISRGASESPSVTLARCVARAINLPLPENLQRTVSVAAQGTAIDQEFVRPLKNT